MKTIQKIKMTIKKFTDAVKLIASPPHSLFDIFAYIVVGLLILLAIFCIYLIIFQNHRTIYIK